MQFLLFLESHILFIREESTGAVFHTFRLSFPNTLMSCTTIDNPEHITESHPTASPVLNAEHVFMFHLVIIDYVAALAQPHTR
jgi:hypothetical protein